MCILGHTSLFEMPTPITGSLNMIGANYKSASTLSVYTVGKSVNIGRKNYYVNFLYYCYNSPVACKVKNFNEK